MLTMAESDDLDWTEGLFGDDFLVGFPVFAECPTWTVCVVLDKGGEWRALDRLPADQDSESTGWVTECFRNQEIIGLYKPIPQWNEVLITDLQDGDDYRGLPCKHVLVNKLLAIPSSCVVVTIDNSGTIESWDVVPTKTKCGWESKEPHTKMLLGVTIPGNMRMIDRQTLEHIEFVNLNGSYTKM